MDNFPRAFLDFEIVDMISYISNMKSRVTERGQVTIPKSLRERLGIQPGQVVEFSEVDGSIVLRRTTTEHPVDQVFGILQTGAAPTNSWRN